MNLRKEAITPTKTTERYHQHQDTDTPPRLSPKPQDPQSILLDLKESEVQPTTSIKKSQVEGNPTPFRRKSGMNRSSREAAQGNSGNKDALVGDILPKQAYTPIQVEIQPIRIEDEEKKDAAPGRRNHERQLPPPAHGMQNESVRMSHQDTALSVFTHDQTLHSSLDVRGSVVDPH